MQVSYDIFNIYIAATDGEPLEAVRSSRYIVITRISSRYGWPESFYFHLERRL